jgi:GAF domain-containing protein/anti-sigma regulatory factor (Ser/Thr protein kinase)
MTDQDAANVNEVLRQQESLRAIIESISSELELRPLLTRIIQSACELLEGARGIIGLVDDERQLVRTEAVYKMPANELGMEMPIGEGLAGQVLAVQEPLILNRYSELAHPVQLDLMQDAVVGIPIFWHGRMIGFFGIGADPPRQFAERDVELLSQLARHAAIAIENARLFAAEKRRAVRQQTLAHIGKIISGTLELDELLQTAVDAIREYLHYTNCGFLLTDPRDSETLVLVGRSGIYVEHLPVDYRQSINEGIIGAAARSRQPILTTDAQNDPRYLPIPGAGDIRAAIGIPVIVGDQLLGVINVESSEMLDEADVALLEIAGNQLGAAIVNARLFAAEKQRTTRQATLNRIGKLITATLDLDDLLQTAVTAIDEELAYPNTAVLLVEHEDPNMLVLNASSGIYAESVKTSYRQPIGKGIIGLAAQSRRPVFVPDVRQDSRYIPIPGAEDIRSELALPIVVGNRLLGVLNVETTRPIDRDEAANLELVSDQLGVAISNAYYFNEMQSNLAETQLLYETSRRMTNAFDVDDVIKTYLQHVAVRGHYVCTIALYEFNEFGERTAVVVRGIWSSEEGLRLVRERLPYARDALDPSLDQGQTILISDVHTDPRVSPQLRRLQAESGRPALAFIPLIVRSQRIGVVILTYQSATAYERKESDLWPYQVTAAQLATAIDTRRQQLLLMQSSQEVAVLHERQRLARELHDSVTQLIFSMTLVTQSVSPAWQRDPAEGEKRVNRLLELSQSALAEMRALLFELHSSDPPPLPTETGVTLPSITRLRRDGLVAALTQHIESLKLECPAISLDAGEYQSQTLEMEITLFRIAQEALNNVVKHAEAEEVKIYLSVGETTICLQIEDDGVGFEPKKDNGRSPNGLGLRTMQERTEAFNGRLEIRSAAGQGTAVKACLPLMNGEAK